MAGNQILVRGIGDLGDPIEAQRPDSGWPACSKQAGG
jgi:hypothetical protein